MVSCYGWSRSSLHLLCLSLLVQEVLCQEVVNIVILPDQMHGAGVWLPRSGENLPSVSSKDRKGRRHSVSGAAPELAQLATPLATPTGTPGASSMTMKAFGRKMPTSGPWEGSVQERGSKRPSQYKLRFLPDQRVAGSTDGPDGTAQISGSFNPENHRVIWTESHPWGSVKVTGHVFYKA
eukprot:g22532.t1